MIILDTNVISELMDTAPEARVIAWADRQRRRQLLTTAITVLELRAGVEELEEGRRRQDLERRIERALDDLLGGRVLRFDRHAAYETATWQAHCRRAGRSVEIRDAQIAGIAMARRIPIATRNVGHFEEVGVKLINPWTAAT